MLGLVIGIGLDHDVTTEVKARQAESCDCKNNYTVVYSAPIHQDNNNRAM